jgi:hypothetical protein
MNQTNIQREGAKSGQKQAHKMVSLSNSTLPAVDVVTIVVSVPDIDGGRLAPEVVVNVNYSCFYLLDTKESLLQRLYIRNEFTNAESNFVDVYDVTSNSVSLVKLNNVWK